MINFNILAGFFRYFVDPLVSLIAGNLQSLFIKQSFDFIKLELLQVLLNMEIYTRQTLSDYKCV